MVSEEEIKNIVIEGYKNILKREPDPDGLANYINEIKKGLSIEGFHSALRTSEEYRQRFGGTISPIINSSNISGDISITYCMMGTNRLHEIKSYIETTLPYVDRFIFIDGGSSDGTVDFLKSISEKNNNKLEIYIHEWQDKFSGQRNNYIKHFKEKQNNGWILVSDTDEHYPVETLSNLKNAIRTAEIEGYNGIKFQVLDIEIDSNDRDKVLSRNKGQYWKALLFRYFPNIHYEGEPHESLVGHPIRWKDTNLVYEHYRSQRKIYERACLTSDSLIITSNGFEEIKNVRVGDLVYSHDGKFHKVNNVVKRYVDEQIYEVKPHKGLPIKITGDHRIYSVRTKQCSEVSGIYSCRKERNLLNCKRCGNKFYMQYVPKWIAIKDLKKSDILIFPKPNIDIFEPGNIISEYYIGTFPNSINVDEYIEKNDTLKNINNSNILGISNYENISSCDAYVCSKEIKLIPETDVVTHLVKRRIIRIDEELMRFFGYWLAEGDTYIDESENEYQIRLNINVYDKFIDDTKQIIKSKVGKDISESLDFESPNLSLRFRDKGVANYLNSTFGKYGTEKIIPIEFLGIKNVYLINLLKGILLGDGTESYVTTSLNTTSRAIASFVYLALIKLDFHPTLVTVENMKEKYGSYGNEKQYRVSIMGSKNLKRLRYIIGSNVPIKEAGHTRNIGYNDERHVYMSIQYIIQYDYKGYVYNLEVEGAESYCSPMVTTHNCENFFISNSNRYTPKWAEFRALCTKNNISKFDQFFKLYKEGTLHTEIEDWIYDNRKGIGNSGDSELIEMAMLYYKILHPNKREFQE